MKKEEKESMAVLMAIEALKYLEGFSSKVYKCIAGKKTIGYGHTLKEDEKFTTISQEKALKLLENDVNYFLQEIKKLIEEKQYNLLNENQICALIVFVFNIGVEYFSKSTLLKKLNAGKSLIDIASEFDKWVYVNKVKNLGLIMRRNAEKELFLLGTKK